MSCSRARLRTKSSLVWLVAALFGCALRIEPVPLAPHLEPIAGTGSGDPRPRLGVGEFADARSRADRLGARPPLRARWYGATRQGFNRTGDGAFIGEVTSALRDDAIVTLARTGMFSLVKAVDVDAAGAPARAARSDLDLVLVGSIDSFAGVQYQDGMLSLALVGWLRNRYADPEGVAHVRYLLYDDRGLQLRSAVETRHQSPGRTIAQAALDALAKANERMADRVFERLIGDTEVRRRVALRVLDGCEVGRARSSRLVDEATRVYRREAGLAFDMHYAPYGGGPPSDDLGAALTRLAAVPVERDELAIAFVSLRSRDAGGKRGLANQLGRRAVVGCAPGGELRALTILHEIGHLFGAVHTPERASIMHATAEFDSRFFDLKNRAHLLAQRDRALDPDPISSPPPARR